MSAERPETKAQPKGRVLAGTLIALFCGPIIWFVHLSVIYGLQTGSCALGWPQAPGAWIIGVSGLFAAPLVLGMAAPGLVARALGASGWPAPSQRFLHGLIAALSLLSLAGVIWGGATVLFMGACPPLR